MSVKSVFEETVKNTVNGFCGNLSHQLSEWLREKKDVDVSPEEICSALEVPYRPPTTPSFNSGVSVQTQLPNYYAGTVSPAKKRGGRTKKSNDPAGPKCEYTLSRGKSVGQPCGQPSLNDGVTLGNDRFCKACLKKAAVQKLLESPENKSTVQPPILPGSSVAVQEETPKSDEISVVAIEGRDGWFRETTYGFIIEQTAGGDIIAHEVEDDQGNPRKLNEADRKLALSRGFQVLNIETVISLPTQPKVSSTLPKIPNVAVPN